MKYVRTPRYRGGKSPRNRGSGLWVASHLPPEYDVTYCEPFGGMANTLLNRPKSSIEIYNELDGRIVNFLQCIRDHGKEMARLIAGTGKWQSEFRVAVERVDDPELPPIRRALYTYIILQFSLGGGLGRPTFGYQWAAPSANGKTSPRDDRLRFEDVLSIRERLLSVKIHNMDGIDVIERLAKEHRAIIYCDPPYPETYTDAYAYRDIDIPRMLDVLPRVEGRVAISGYGDIWDSLGWRREELETSYHHFKGPTAGSARRDSPRVEVLWMNYDLPAMLL